MNRTLILTGMLLISVAALAPPASAYACESVPNDEVSAAVCQTENLVLGTAFGEAQYQLQCVSGLAGVIAYADCVAHGWVPGVHECTGIPEPLNTLLCSN